MTTWRDIIDTKYYGRRYLATLPAGFRAKLPLGYLRCHFALLRIPVTRQPQAARMVLIAENPLRHGSLRIKVLTLVSAKPSMLAARHVVLFPGPYEACIQPPPSLSCPGCSPYSTSACAGIAGIAGIAITLAVPASQICSAAALRPLDRRVGQASSSLVKPPNTTTVVQEVQSLTSSRSCLL